MYNWRRREDSTSLTQQKFNPDDLADRLEVMRSVSRVISEGASKATFSSWLAKAIGFDCRSYYEQVPRTDLAYWKQLRKGVLGLAELMTDDIWLEIAMVDRYLALATIEDARDERIRFVTKHDWFGWTHPSVLHDGSLLLDQSYLSECDYVPPPQQMQFAEADIQLVSKMKEDGR